MWLIVGYGNTLRGDDGAGYRLAELLQERLSPHRARVLAQHQLTPELALELASPDIDRALFLDARRGQWEPLILTPIHPSSDGGSCGHQLAPELLLQMAGSLYGHAPQSWLLTLPASRFDMGEGLSAAAAAGVKFSTLQIKGLIAGGPKTVVNPSSGYLANRSNQLP